MSAELPKKVVVWASVGAGTDSRPMERREETHEVPAEITTQAELEEWATGLAAEMAESGWYPAEGEDE